tara:strand:+ start:1703 stop:2179 length:477 start_codon:yes stop_codon:yes gene_type:complete
MSYTIKDIYKEYHTITNEPVDKKLFRTLCEEFNINIMSKILKGAEFNMGNNLSSVSIVRVNRDPRSPRVDWGESNKYKKELLDQGQELYDSKTSSGVKWHIYYTDTFYCKYYWKKGKCRVSNKSVYRFTPTRGLKGNKEKLINMLKQDDLAYLKFKKN